MVAYKLTSVCLLIRVIQDLIYSLAKASIIMVLSSIIHYQIDIIHNK